MTAYFRVVEPVLLRSLAAKPGQYVAHWPDEGGTLCVIDEARTHVLRSHSVPASAALPDLQALAQSACLQPLIA